MVKTLNLFDEHLPNIILRVMLFLSCSFAPHLSSASAELEEKFGTRPLDGVIVEALESYRNPKKSQLGFDLGYWPFNSYYTGFSVNVGYTYFLDKTYAWEVVQASYIYSVEKQLTSELADSYGVNPVKIERAEYALSSNLIYYLSYGKFIFLKEYIRYFRSGLIGGVAMVASNKQTEVGPSLGWRFEVYVNDNFSWKFDLRDYVTITGEVTNNVAFNLGAAYSFE